MKQIHFFGGNTSLIKQLPYFPSNYSFYHFSECLIQKQRTFKIIHFFVLIFLPAAHYNISDSAELGVKEPNLISLLAERI